MNILKLLFFIFITFVFFSCATTESQHNPNRFARAPSRTQSMAEPANLNRTHLFPEGIYIHRITFKDPKGKKRQFKGILQLKENAIALTGLAAFDTTFFKLNQEFNSDKISYKFYHEVPKAFEEKFILFYGVLKKIFQLPLQAESLYKELDSGLELKFSKYDGNRIPWLLEIKKDDFKMNIILEKYELSRQEKE